MFCHLRMRHLVAVHTDCHPAVGADMCETISPQTAYSPRRFRAATTSRLVFLSIHDIVSRMRSILPHEENPVLRSEAKAIPLSDISSAHVKSLIADMKELLAKEEHGVALAAPQVGESVRLFIVSGKALARDAHAHADEDADEASEPAITLPDEVYINPSFTKVSRQKKDKHEGCLSVRGKWGVVPRAEKATIHAYDEHGKEVLRGASGFLAHIFQHEMDHLDGVLYIDKAKEVYEEEHDE